MAVSLSFSALILRFDSALRLNVRFHSLFLDGVFVRSVDRVLEFIELPEPSPEQVEEVARRTAKRIACLLEKAGKSLDPEMADAFEDDFALSQPVLASCYGAASGGADLSGDRAGQSTLRLFQQDEVKKTEPAAVVGGVNVHAGVAFDGRDKPRFAGERSEQMWMTGGFRRVETMRFEGVISRA